MKDHIFKNAILDAIAELNLEEADQVLSFINNLKENEVVDARVHQRKHAMLQIKEALKGTNNEFPFEVTAA